MRQAVAILAFLYTLTSGKPLLAALWGFNLALLLVPYPPMYDISTRRRPRVDSDRLSE